MAGFMQNNQFNNGSNMNVEKRRENFAVGKVHGDNAKLDVSVWTPATGTRVLFTITQAIGKDPTTGSVSYEQRQPKDMPRFFMNMDITRAFIEVTKGVDPSTLNFTLDAGKSKLTVVGSASNVQMKIETPDKGFREITLGATNVGGKYIHTGFLNLINFVEFGFLKGMTQKLDPEEFGMAVNGNNNSDDTPF